MQVLIARVYGNSKVQIYSQYLFQNMFLFNI